MGSEIQLQVTDKHIWLAGRDLWPEWRSDLQTRARALREDPLLEPLPPSLKATSLGEAPNEQAYLDQAAAMLRRKCHVDTLSYPIPHRRGGLGKLQLAVRKFLWKLLKYQHDRMAFRQNLIHSQIVAQLEYQRDEAKRALAELRARVDRLEGNRE